jgi:CubicO group peptidase (beta-lactamase class C family)
VLALTYPDGSQVDPATFGAVTIQQLLEHRSGLIHPRQPLKPDEALSPYGVEPDVAAAFTAAGTPTQLPVDGRETDRYLATMPTYPPPQPPAYNNWGYFLLGHVVLTLTGAPTLATALNQLLFKPLSSKGVRSSRTRVEGQLPSEARYHPSFFETGHSVVDPDRRLRATGYGGFFNLERDDGAGGLSASVVDVARLLAMLDIRRANPVLKPAAIANLFTLATAGGGHGFDSAQVIDPAGGIYYGMKGGSLPESSQNSIRYQTNDISMVVCWNRHDITEGGNDGWWYPDFPALLTIARTTAWGNKDLFPHFHMPTLKK